MKKTLHPENTRGSADHGWLKARFSFSFGSWVDRNRMGFGLLRVINDDIIEPSGGFGTHGHENMEIVTIPLTGELAHKDSMGNTETIKAGEVQRMSAGSGLTHSEFNHSDAEKINLLQIWVLPKEKNIEANYEQSQFSEEHRKNKWQCLVSPKKTEGSLSINQDAYFYRTSLNENNEISYSVKTPGNGIYIYVITGEIEVADETLGRRDALGLEDLVDIKLRALKDSDVLIIEIPLN